jgi:hypothetical protein
MRLASLLNSLLALVRSPAVLIGYVVYPTQQLTSGVRSFNIMLQNLSNFTNSSCIKPLTSSAQNETEVLDGLVRLWHARGAILLLIDRLTPYRACRPASPATQSPTHR